MIFPVLLLGISNLTAQFNIAHLSEAKSNIATVRFGDKVFFVSGKTNGSDSRLVETYHISTNSWSEEEYTNDGVLGMQLMATDSYAMGYHLLGVNLLLEELILYNNYTGVWQRLDHPDVAYNNSESICFTIGEKAYLTDGTNSNTADVYDFTSDTWTVDTLPFAKRDIGFASVNNKLFFMAGRTDFSTWSRRADVYNLDTDTWEWFNLTIPRSNFRTIVAGNKIVIAGGRNSNVSPTGLVDLIEIIDADTYEISTLQLSKKKINMQGAAANNKVVFIGGNSSEAEIIDLTENSKQIVDLGVGGNLEGLQAAVLGEQIVFAGASGANGQYAFVYHTGTDTFSTIELDFARTGVAMAVTDQSILIAGGEKTDGQATSEIVILESGCFGELSDADGDGVCDTYDQCPGFDDLQDSDQDGLPDGCDPCVNLNGELCNGTPCIIDPAIISSGGYIAEESLQATGTIPADGEVRFYAPEVISLLPGFNAQAGAKFSAQIATCEPFVLNFEKSRVKESTTNAGNPKLSDHPVPVAVRVFPNPFSTSFELQFSSIASKDDTEIDIWIVDQLGQIQYQKQRHLPSNNLTIPTADWPAGLYFIQFRCGYRYGVQKVVKN